MRQSHKRRGLDRKQTVARGSKLFEKAVEAHRAGNRDRARQLYRTVLVAQPRHADACHLLGFAEFQSSQFRAAIEYLERAVAICPNNAEFHNNLALAYLATELLEPATQHATQARDLGHCDGHGYLHVGWEFFRCRRLESAESAYRLALLIQPTSAEAHNCLGVLHASHRRWDAAVASYQRAIELCPTFLEALNNLGNAFRDQQRIAEAVPYYEQALRLDPQFVLAHNNLGVALSQDGQSAAAIECYQRALRCQPQSIEALNNLGNACYDLGRTEEAIECYRQALQLQPGSAEILCNLGARLRQLGQLPAAVAYLRRAIMLQPYSAKIYQHLASALADEGRFTEASACCHHLITLEPEQPLWKLRAAALCPLVFQSRSEMSAFTQGLAEGIAAVRRAGFNLDWAHIAEIGPPFPFEIQYLDGDPKPLKEAYAEIFRERLKTPRCGAWIESWRGPRTRPRVGFVVTEGHEGVFLKTLRAVIERFSPHWELVVFCSQRGASRVRTEIQRDDLQVVPAPMRCDRLAETIAETQCDLLYHYEVGTDATNYFLPFLRLAPVQITSWGVQLTSGIPNLDAYLSSELIEPIDAQKFYTEKLFLTRTLLTYRRRTELPTSLHSRENFAVPTNAHWYVCAQQLGKMHVDFDDLLGGILRQDPCGVVVLTGDKFGHYADRLRRRFATSIADVAQRIHFLTRLDQSTYVSLLHHADVLLDPPHFGGANSTYDGLSLGKPIVSLPAPFQRGRYTLGCYRQMRFPDCVVETGEQYIALAVRLGVDQEFRHDLSNRLLAASHVIFEDDTVVSEHERIFLELLQSTKRQYR